MWCFFFVVVVVVVDHFEADDDDGGDDDDDAGDDDDDDDYDDDDDDGCDDDGGGGDDDFAAAAADDDDDAADVADPTLHLLACWPAVGRQPLKSGQGPPGRGIAVRQFSALRRREGPPPLPPTSPPRQKLLRFYGVLCSSHFFPFFRSCGSRWVNMGQHRPQDGPT